MNTRNTLIVAKLLTNAEQLYECGLALQFSMLDDCIRNTASLGVAMADSLQRELIPLKSLNALEFVKKGTPFFWKNICCGIDVLVRGCADFNTLSRHLLMTAFDAYFEQLPIGTTFTLPAVEGSDIILPQLGIRVRSSGAITALRLVSHRILEVEGRDCHFAIDLDRIEPALQLPTIPIPGFEPAVLLMISEPVLFEEKYIDDILPDLPGAVAHAKMIARALDLIATVDNELGLQIAKVVRWYVPLMTPDVGVVHKSHTSPNLNGVLFLSEAGTDIDLAEAIVHEFYHTELFILMDTQDVIAEQTGEKFYSPWRNDPRPLYGLFHALYVFSGVANFYIAVEKLFRDAKEVERLRGRRLEVCYQLRLGLAQVPDNRLADIGRTIIQSMKEDLESHEMELGFSSQKLPVQVKAHLNAWCKANPELVSVVQMPDALVSH
ncbi:aKG-HExxH-type peptide beta-hydroxylase [Nostoc sp. 'Peltigera membranacea cyanobiont' 232]|uniref:aKG-HExxH-type peptide beta-hydroxylase n=1 Tax=Nostoc sp. 'Peltigera membranacea cyanobiont' 232 TaxID=2014531 RepID=UPI000B95832D|nr:HEXXH motif-containing putative peptide modification protein [Nostoc sp. 'Peltigera membranacea cyanobiont' 232]OYE01192.1 hypothetical protein CDG79_30930 [Nostoc sp. 'Peltigera membranacea cyanobiont' 232]